MDLKEELDALIGAVQRQQQRENHALLNIASVLHRYGLAKSELIALGGVVDEMRNPPPLPSEDLPPPPMPPPTVQSGPPPLDRAAAAEAAEQVQWEFYRRDAARRTFAQE